MKTRNQLVVDEIRRNAAKAEAKAAKVCSICGADYTGWGNNAEPVNSGRCCDDCNWAAVVPSRIRAMRRSGQA